MSLDASVESSTPSGQGSPPFGQTPPFSDQGSSVPEIVGGLSSRPGKGVGDRADTPVGFGRRWIRRALYFLGRVLTAPIRSYLSLRRSMTVASVSVLLAAFMTLNVIWGFPWNGMMGACTALLVVGLAINRIMCPRLKLSISLPRSAVAGQPFSVNVHLTNVRKLPALNLRVGWHREGVRDIYPKRSAMAWDASEPVSLDLLRSGDQLQWHGAMRFHARGIHDLPDFQVASTFPFHLFYCRKGVSTETQIAITPAPASDDDDPTSRAMLAAIGDWSQKLVAGAPVEYVGNREYEVGVPVRRWDFASWARLGRPIVREYQSPSIQTVTLIVDTSQREGDERSTSRGAARQQRREAEEWFERLMSVSATAIAEITHRRVQLNLCVTDQPIVDRPMRGGANSSEGAESMLVRLAAAQPVDPVVGEARILEAIQSSRSQPTLIFSMIDLGDPNRTSLANTLPGHVTYMTIRAPRPSERWESTGESDER